MNDARAWLRRFDPCVLLVEEDGQRWVTDQARMHRVPPDIAEDLTDIELAPGAAAELLWDASGDGFTAVPSESFRVQDAFSDLVGSTELPVQAVDRRAGVVRLTTTDSESVYLDLIAYEQALDDGVTLWIGRGPGRVVYGAGARSLVYAVFEPVEPPVPPAWLPR